MCSAALCTVVPWRLGATNQAKSLTQASKPLAAASATWLDSATQKPWLHGYLWQVDVHENSHSKI